MQEFSKVNEKIITITFGEIFIIIIVWLVFTDSVPSEFQKRILIIILALSAAGVATGFSGFFGININGKIKCSGAMAIFVIVYLVNPVKIVTENKSVWREQSMVYFYVDNHGLPDEPNVYITTSGYADVQNERISFAVKDIDFKMTGNSGLKSLTITSIGVGIFCYSSRDIKIYTPEYKKTNLKISNDGRVYYISENRFIIKKPSVSVRLSECVVSVFLHLEDPLTGKKYTSAASSAQGVFD